MVKRIVARIEVPAVASASELRTFVEKVYEESSCCYLTAAKELRVTAATVWKLLNDQQADSPIIREKWHIRKTPHRPRVWIPTNNLARALEVLTTHYPEVTGISFAVKHRADEYHD